MARSIYYPPADRSQWYGNGNATVSPDKVLWHTTETAGGWPGYASGTTAPNMTYDPWTHRWRQHFPLNGSARALKNGPNGYQTNRKGPMQIEISCYCDPSKVSTGKHISQLDAQAYDNMHDLSVFMQKEWGIPLRSTVTFKPYPSSYGNNGVRLGATAFADYAGHLGHQHAYANDHGDPGNIDIARILRSVPKPPEPDMPLTPADVSLIQNAALRASFAAFRQKSNGRVYVRTQSGYLWIGPAAWAALVHMGANLVYDGVSDADAAALLKTFGNATPPGTDHDTVPTT